MGISNATEISLMFDLKVTHQKTILHLLTLLLGLTLARAHEILHELRVCLTNFNRVNIVRVVCSCIIVVAYLLII